jgi:UDP-N-acetylmuramate--alanine ligase
LQLCSQSMSTMRIGIFFGGPSRERELSYASGRAVYDQLDRKLFEPLPIFVDSYRNFILLDWQHLYHNNIREFYPPAEGLPGSPHDFQIYIESLGVLSASTQDAIIAKIGRPISREELSGLIDMAFLAMYGEYGEDGQIQQELEALGIPYTGSGARACQISMDRSIQKDLMAVLGFARPEVYTLTREEWLSANANDIYQEVISQAGFPIVVHPNKQGTSIGMSVVEENAGLEGFELAVNRAFFREVVPVYEWQDRSAFDRREYLQILSDPWDGLGFPIVLSFQGQEQLVYHPEVLLELLDRYAAQANEGESFILESIHKEDKLIIEPFISGREFSCIVLRKEDGMAIALPPTEIVKSSKLLDYQAKFKPSQARHVTPIALPAEQLAAIRQQCVRLFEEVGCQAFARIDGFINPRGELVLNEPNTTLPFLPGAYTYQQAAAIGLSPTQLLTYLLAISLRERLATAPQKGNSQGLLNQLETNILASRAAFSHKKRIGVLLGGISEERGLSVESGRHVFEKLSSLGEYELLPIFLGGSPVRLELYHLPLPLLFQGDVEEIVRKISYFPPSAVISEIRAQCADIYTKYAPANTAFDPRQVSLSDLPQMVDAVFIALQSSDAGQSGILAELEVRKIPYNGPSAQVFGVTNNRYQAIQTLQRNSFKTAKQVLLHKRDYETDAEIFFKRVESQLHYPFIGKPAEGSGRSAFRMLNSRSELEAYARMMFRPENEEGVEARRVLRLKAREAFPRQSQILFESPMPAKGALQFVPITAGLLASKAADGRPVFEIFPPTEALSPSGAFSPEGEISAGAGPAPRLASFGQSAEAHRLIEGQVRQSVESIARILNLQGCAAIQALVRVYEDHSVELIPLEVDVMPSLYPGSSLFIQAAQHGYTPHQLLDKILSLALRQHAPPAKPDPIPSPMATSPGASASPAASGAQRQEPIIQHQKSMEQKGDGFRPQPFGQYFLQRMRELAAEAGAFLKHPLFLRNFAGLLGAVLLFYLLTTWVLKIYTRHGESLQVPNYVGMDLDDALAKARQQRFKIVVVDSFFDSSRDPNTIFQQDPRPLQRAKEGRTIYVSKYRITPDSVILPSLMSASYNFNQYAIKLKRLDVQAVVKERVFDSKQEENTIQHFFHRDRKITDEMLRGGVKVPKGATLEFVITERLSSNVPIPDLICKRYDAAVFLLSSSNLSLGNIYGDVANRQQAYVYRQEPEYMPGQVIAQGQQISIYLTLTRPSGCPEDPEDGFGNGRGQESAPLDDDGF